MQVVAKRRGENMGCSLLAGAVAPPAPLPGCLLSMWQLLSIKDAFSPKRRRFYYFCYMGNLSSDKYFPLPTSVLISVHKYGARALPNAPAFLQTPLLYTSNWPMHF